MLLYKHVKSITYKLKNRKIAVRNNTLGQLSMSGNELELKPTCLLNTFEL